MKIGKLLSRFGSLAIQEHCHMTPSTICHVLLILFSLFIDLSETQNVRTRILLILRAAIRVFVILLAAASD
ncbi:hypothetical protein [Tritonibacter mobilis]|uniref:hypothetical protein n=1 Tax=Tritonibacter mobilis TaxID=379347 RepID=UPI001CDA4AC9|nr:hypothetical protein [Tritonibacter mobilis]MCA2007707.1 hypothetical protein [Tritonibacter mobilis]